MLRAFIITPDDAYFVPFSRHRSNDSEDEESSVRLTNLNTVGFRKPHVSCFWMVNLDPVFEWISLDHFLYNFFLQYMLTLEPSVARCWIRCFRSLNLSLIAKKSNQSVTIFYYILCFDSFVIRQSPYTKDTSSQRWCAPGFKARLMDRSCEKRISKMSGGRMSDIQIRTVNYTL